MSKPALWRITCMEDEYPGLWRLWFMHQCVTDGHSPEKGFEMVGRTKGETSWNTTRNALKKIGRDDLILVTLPNRRIGRIGQVVDNKAEEWNALVDGEPGGWKDGYMGRRILVRWELDRAPDTWDTVVQVPEDVRMRWRGTLHSVQKPDVERFRDLIADQANWVPMAGRFGYEQALSDYIAQFPHKLKSGLERYPDEKVRERRLRGGSRADVLLRDSGGKPVIVECKQGPPSPKDVKQLQGYIRSSKKCIGGRAGGILVHGGARTVDEEVWDQADKRPCVEIFQYKLDVDFLPSCRSGGS